MSRHSLSGIYRREKKKSTCRVRPKECGAHDMPRETIVPRFTLSTIIHMTQARMLTLIDMTHYTRKQRSAFCMIYTYIYILYIS
jgi:hypothetical protein